VYRARSLGVSPDYAVTWLPFAGGLQEIGHDGAGFAYDNEDRGIACTCSRTSSPTGW
jgi:hypothetical protein